MLQLLRPVEMLGYAMQAFSQGTALVAPMIGLLKESPEIEPSASAPLAAELASLEFRQVSFAYRHERPALTDVSFTLPAGKTVAIVGSSGAGKSSIVRLLVQLVEPTSGEILLNGVPVTQFARAALRRAVSVVPQDVVLFNDTIAYNIGRTARRRRSSTRRAWRICTSSSPACPRAIRHASGSAASNSPAASASVCRLRAPPSASRSSTCSTRPPRRWTAAPSARFCIACAKWRVTAPRW
jgi:ABC-type multidrug transport system fused ATPase/permease subunit